MATVDKNFRIKNGLVIEGSTATLNGNNILSENTQAGDSYILNLVGGATLVKSVGSNLSVDGAGELSLDLVGIVEDIAGTRLTTDGSTLNVDVDGIADDLTGSYDFATNSDVTFAVGAESTNRDAAISAAVTNLEAYADQAEADAITSSNSYTDGRETAITSAYQSYADTAEADAKTYADGLAVNYDAAGSAATAEQNAKDYADNKINDASNLSTEVWSAYKTATEISVAQTAAEAYTDTREGAITTAYEAYADQAELDAVATANAYTDAEVAALVDSAPALLDTLNELAAAIGDNPNYAADLATSVGERVAKAGDTMTGLLVLSADPSANLGAATKQYVDQAEADAVTTANAYTDTREGAITTAYEAYADQAEVDAKAYTDTREGAITTAYEAYADQAETDAIASAQAALDDLLDATTPFTEINVNDQAKQIAATATITTGSASTVYQWAKADYRSAKLLVKVDNGTHTEISEILLTLDSSDNLAITEYAIVGTNGSRGTIAATISGSNVTVTVNPTDNSTVKITGTLLK
jgi:hypothetical protein